jgi:hypothetical protein
MIESGLTGPRQLISRHPPVRPELDNLRLFHFHQGLVKGTRKEAKKNEPWRILACAEQYRSLGVPSFPIHCHNGAVSVSRRFPN